MKLFSIAAFLAGIVLVTMSVRHRKQHPPALGLTDTDRLYAIDDLMNGLD
ncbi:MAG TPA: hypothetical protein VI932_11065 [Bacteroidota bacterium]|nr:hypothetical protein [Bacteroidota bacterium]